MYLCVHRYVYVCICICVQTYIYIYIERKREAHRHVQIRIDSSSAKYAFAIPTQESHLGLPLNYVLFGGAVSALKRNNGLQLRGAC